MARLNEPQLPTESLESLKRRCIRQNREIAKINSTQSIRIRSLEVEISRLLAENLALREQVIKLQGEVERRSTRNTLHNVGLVKGKLETKLAELGNLVLELGEIQSRRRTSHRPSGGHSENLSTKRSPDQRNWRNTLTLSEVTAGQIGRLPPILEDKLYPRRTLDSEEVRGVLPDAANLVDSPDLGPPPVAHYEFEGDPVKHDSSMDILGPNDDSGFPTASAFSNLVTRKKRRAVDNVLSNGIDHEDSLNPNPPDSTLLDSQTPINPAPGQSFRSGAKRKLSVRDDDEQRGSQITVKDGFQFNRRNESQTPIMSDTPMKEVTLTKSNEPIISETMLVSAEPDKNQVLELPSAQLKIRQALGEKNINTDPTASPVKNSKVGRGEKIGVFKDELIKRPQERDRIREKPIATKIVRIPDRTKAPKAVAVKPSTTAIEPTSVILAQPELDAFSPTPNEIPASSVQSRDTPPPSDLAGRASRRSRGNVSYAEPSLREKMRRPTKALVDAVGVDERIPKAVGTNSDNENDDVLFERAIEKAKARDTVVKKEDSTSESTAWKSLPNEQTPEKQSLATEPPGSPLGIKSSSVVSVGNLPVSVMTDRKRRASAIPSRNDDNVSEPEVQLRIPSSGSNNAIAALVAGGHKRVPRILNSSAAENVMKASSDRTTQVHNTPDIDEESSHIADTKDLTIAKAPSLGLKGGAGAAKLSSKRYSSVPEGLSSRAGGGTNTNDTANAATQQRPASRGSRKRDTTILESASAPSLAPHGNSGGGSGKAADTARMERLAGRRRSMML